MDIIEKANIVRQWRSDVANGCVSHHPWFGTALRLSEDYLSFNNISHEELEKICDMASVGEHKVMHYMGEFIPIIPYKRRTKTNTTDPVEREVKPYIAS